MSIGSKIKNLCEDNDISIKKLAKQVYVSQASMYAYTYDKCYPNCEVLHEIAKFFGVKMEYFWDE